MALQLKKISNLAPVSPNNPIICFDNSHRRGIHSRQRMGECIVEQPCEIRQFMAGIKC
jgi:hypothetical protein